MTQIKKGQTSIGIDLGLKDLATCSDGVKLKAPQIYRQYEQKLGIAQRAKNKKRVKAIHAKIKNVRQNMLHQFSHKLVNEHAAIFVGNVNAKALAQTKLAKSVTDIPNPLSFKTFGFEFIIFVKTSFAFLILSS